MRFVPVAFATLIALLVLGSTGTVSAQVAVDTASLNRGIRPYEQPIDPDRYLIRPGESIRVIFLNTQLDDMWLSVDAEGKITHRQLGSFTLAGLTLTEARNRLIGPLSRLFNAESIEITVNNIYPVSIVVTGAVRKPGRYLGFTSQTVDEIIDSAGGLTPDASRRRIVFSGGPQLIEIDLLSATAGGVADLSACLYSGTTVHVPSAGDSIVQVVGEVRVPQAIELRPSDNLATLVRLAGGYTFMADSNAVYIANDRTREPGAVGTFQPGDIIMVPRKSNRAQSNSVVITGGVVNSGRYGYVKGLQISACIDKAGGTTTEANLDRITVFREIETEPEKPSVGIRYPLLLDITADRNGTEIKPGDSIFVPVKLGFVQVIGFVKRPGFYPYERGKAISYYVNMAGGIADDKSDISVMLYDRVSGLTRVSKLAESIYDGDRIVIRQEVPGS